MADTATAAKRARKPKEPKKSSAANMIAGLEFVSIAQHEKGEPRQTHCIIENKRIVASDGALSAGVIIEDEIEAVPNTRLMLAALRRAEGSIAIVQLPSGRISIKGGKFSAMVPCLPRDQVPSIWPDPKIATLTNDVKLALAACAPLTNESAPEARNAGILLQSMTAVASNGYCLLEYWHGIDLPPNLLIPKAAAIAVSTCPKNLTGFGYSTNEQGVARSVTFHFEDDSFIKTQLFAGQYPDYQRILNKPSNPWPMPPDFFTAVDVLKEFAPTHALFLCANEMRTSRLEDEGMAYKVEGLTNGMGFNEKYLNLCRPHMIRAHFDPANGEVLFFSDTARGIVKGIHMESREEAAPVPPPPMPGGPTDVQYTPSIPDPDMQQDYQWDNLPQY